MKQKNMFRILSIKLFFLTTVLSESTLRYTKTSCSTLEPSYQELNFGNLDLGPDFLREEDFGQVDDAENSLQFVQPPKRLNARSPPFQIEIDFQQYRTSRDYQVRFVAFDHIDAFMFQVVRRGDVDLRRNADNVSQLQIGTWTKLPAIAMTLACMDGKPHTAVVDKGRPIKIGNMTFVWRSPDKDVGPIRILGSVVYKNAFVKIHAKTGGRGSGADGSEIPFKSFPMTTKDCGRTRGCFRTCKTEPNCPTDQVDYIVTMDTSKSDSSIGSNEVLFRLGGKLSRQKENFIGLGLGKDYFQMRNTDLFVCTREGNRIDGSHYLLENNEGKPQVHRASIDLTTFGVDEETEFAYCAFIRPISPETLYDLDLRQPMHQFYMTGAWNSSQSRPVLNQQSLLTSEMSINISEPYNDIKFLVTDSTANYKNNSQYTFYCHPGCHLIIIIGMIFAFIRIESYV